MLEKVWITQYALTTGIVVLENVCECVDNKKIVDTSGHPPVVYHKPDWHTTAAEANARVVAMLKPKLKAALLEASKIEAMIKVYGG